MSGELYSAHTQARDVMYTQHVNTFFSRFTQLFSNLPSAIRSVHESERYFFSQKSNDTETDRRLQCDCFTLAIERAAVKVSETHDEETRS